MRVYFTTGGEKVDRNLKQCKENRKNYLSINKIIIAVLVIAFVTVVGLLLNNKEKIDYVDYNYGDVITKNNVLKGKKYIVPKGLEISFDRQEIISSETLKKISDLNDGENDVSVITVTMENKSQNPVSYYRLGLSYVTKEGVKLDEPWGMSFSDLGKEYDQEEFRSGDLLPGTKFTQTITVDTPKNDPISKVKWDYFDIKFTVQLDD